MKQGKTVFELLGISSKITPTQLQFGYLEFLGEKYFDHPHAGMVSDAIVSAQEILCDDFPVATDVFLEALKYNRELVNKQVYTLSDVCFVEQVRLGDKEKLANKFFKVRGMLVDEQRINFREFQKNKDVIVGGGLSVRTGLVDLLDEVEVSNQVIDTVKRSVINLLDEMEFFDAWMDSTEFEKFSQAYDFLQYAMTRVHERKSTFQKGLRYA